MWRIPVAADLADRLISYELNFATFVGFTFPFAWANIDVPRHLRVPRTAQHDLDDSPGISGFGIRNVCDPLTASPFSFPGPHRP